MIGVPSLMSFNPARFLLPSPVSTRCSSITDCISFKMLTLPLSRKAKLTFNLTLPAVIPAIPLNPGWNARLLPLNTVEN